MPTNIDLTDSLEKIPVKIFETPKEGAIYAAEEVSKLIRSRNEKDENTVLGLATGSTPKLFYQELVRMHKEEGLSLKNVITFNLDEYYPIAPDAINSYHYYMHKILFDQTDIDPINCHLPSGIVPKDRIKEEVAAYEKQIEKVGGIDLQILGIGNNGHIGFNEPGSPVYSKTRLISLENSTRIANSSEFGNISEVPRMAITMGLSTIMQSKRIILMAWGKSKAPVIQKSVEGRPTEEVPASFLQHHDNCTFILDESAATDLTRFKFPWLTGECEWTPQIIKRAVTHMALKLEKPVLSLSNHDYNDFGLSDLLVEKGEAYKINLEVYYMLRDSITGWPGGKPDNERANHPERTKPFPKRSLIFSPHPDDDIISMGGTFMRLHDQGHDVHVAYQTSGNIAVTDEFVTRFLDFTVNFDKMFDIDHKVSQELYDKATSYISTKTSSQMDSPDIRSIKGLIRRCEARATCKYVGLNDSQIHFMNLPFYETGTIEKKPMSKEDVDLTVKLLRDLKPNQIFCAGDLADPHGTHKVCLDVVLASLEVIRNEPDNEWLNDCYVWLYKGAWEEWAIDEIEMAVPMSPEQARKKRYGIYIHQSQKDSVPFQGTDEREFWQRAEERNANTANLYARLGLTKYAAMEAFVRLK